MSGLGELLLGKTTNDSQSRSAGDDNSNNNKKKIEIDKSRCKPDRRDESENSRENVEYPGDRMQRIFPNRIEKGKVHEDDNQSGASSTDDYVRELLDPNDRPRNVWHVVEGPKRCTDDEASETGQRREDTVVESGESSPYAHNVKIEANKDISPENRNQVKTESEHENRRRSSNRNDITRDRSRDRLSPSRYHSNRREGRHGSEEDRKRSDRDHHRSSSSRNKSHRRRDYSDDEDDYDRRRRGKDAKHDRKRSLSRSRSPVSSSRHHDRSRSNSPQRNSRTVIVMQLSQRVVSRDIEHYFDDAVGNVREVRLIMDNKTRRHKGVAYIEFNDSRSAFKALSLNGRKLHGAPFSIQPVTSRSSEYHSSTSQHHSSSSSRSNHHASSSTYPSSRSLPPNAYRVYIGALHTGVTDEMLRTIVEPFGPVLRVEVIKDRTTGISRGYAFVTYANTEDGQEAVRCLDGFELAGKNMRVSKSTEKSEH